MALSSRLLSRSKQLYSGRIIPQHEHVVPARCFSKEASLPALKGDGLTDDLGTEAMMMDALEKVENELKKPLLRSDKKGMSLLLAEFDKINKKLGIRKEDLPKYEEQLELKIAKGQLEELKRDVPEAMETQKKRKEFKEVEMVGVKSLDIRNFI